LGVSDLSRYDTLLNGIMTQQAQLQQLSLEQTTGTTLNQPSDDPAGTSELLGINLDLSQISTFQKNAALVQTNMNTEDSVETSLGQLLQSAQTIAQGVGTEPVGSTSRNQAISELGNVLQQIVSLANTQVGDDYIFGGTNSGTPPMQSTGGTASAVLGTSLTSGTVATASSTATAATGVYQLTSDGAGDVTLTNTSDPSETQTVTGVTNGTPSINFGTLGVTVTAGSNFTVAGLNGQTIAVGSGYTYGGNTTRPQVTVGVGDTVQTNHTGDQVFGNSIAALQATIAAVEGGTQGDVSNAANQLSTTQTQVLAIQSDGGVTLQQVSSIGTQQTAQQSTLQTQQSNLDAVSQDQIAVQLLQVQNALEASFEVTGRIASLNLANYLPTTGA
jgi:flagellar hook-associated protein 3 FlgL